MLDVAIGGLWISLVDESESAHHRYATQIVAYQWCHASSRALARAIDVALRQVVRLVRLEHRAGRRIPNEEEDRGRAQYAGADEAARAERPDPIALVIFRRQPVLPPKENDTSNGSPNR